MKNLNQVKFNVFILMTALLLGVLPMSQAKAMDYLHLASAAKGLVDKQMAAGQQDGLSNQTSPNVTLNGCLAKTAFSPKGGGTELVVKTIESAQKQIRLAAYSFTEPAIGKALFDAHKRGVDVAVVLDTEHNGRKSTASVADYLASNGVPVRVTRAFKIMHNKFVVVDGVTVETGSFNFSRAAETSNAENVLVISQCPSLASSYLPVWGRIWDTGVALKGGY